jgi:aminoglycoside phosphotransferase (APT) family kinase protein
MELLATGREADVFALDESRVLRRMRRGIPVAWEADLAAHLRAHDYPVPAVLDVDGGDTVYERMAGRTMLDDLGDHPWRLVRHARTLADLHDRLHAIPPPRCLPDGLAPGDTIVHHDLHPANVLITPAGPCVIDWTHATRGAGALDLALTWVILRTAELPTTGVDRLVQSAGRLLFLNRFLRAAGRSRARSALGDAVGLRLLDPSLGDQERAAVERLGSRAS